MEMQKKVPENFMEHQEFIQKDHYCAESLMDSNIRDLSNLNKLEKLQD